MKGIVRALLTCGAVGMLAITGCDRTGSMLGSDESSASRARSVSPSSILHIGDFRTQTQGDWFSRNPRNKTFQYLNAHFPSCFAGGLVVGGTYTMTLTNSAAITALGPTGNIPRPLRASYVDPQGTEASKAQYEAGSLLGQVIALALNIGFDGCDSDFGKSAVHLKDLIVTCGPFAGWTVQEVFTEANKILGGDPSAFKPSQINLALITINSNFNHGTRVGTCLALPEPALPDSSSCMDPVFLGTAADFAILAGTTVTNTGATSITGNLGLSPGTSVTGFPPGIILGTQHAADAVAAAAQTDLTTAYNDAAGRTLAPVSVAGNIGGQTLTPGIYKASSSLAISSGDLTLDGQGDSCTVFIFQIPSTLTITSGRQVILINGATAGNIYWQVGSSATLGTTSAFQGTIMADQSITLETGATLNGRALARNGAVTLDSNTVVKPAP